MGHSHRILGKLNLAGQDLLEMGAQRRLAHFGQGGVLILNPCLSCMGQSGSAFVDLTVSLWRVASRIKDVFTFGRLFSGVIVELAALLGFDGSLFLTQGR